MTGIDLTGISTEIISLPHVANKNIETAILRLDRIHPLISGNKWFKLRYYIEEAKQVHKKTIVTFGGAWSNHILATAAACNHWGLKSAGIIRGDEPAVYSRVLEQARLLGMQLIFISREDFAREKIPGELLQDDKYIIRQGGFGPKGAKGAAEILNYTRKEEFTHICCAAGTGTMMAGLALAASGAQKIAGISVLKNNTRLEHHVSELALTGADHCQYFHDYHFGGYARFNDELIQFMNELYRKNNVPTDFVYTGKLAFAVADLVKKNFFPAGSRLLLIHSGGLTGNASLKKGTLIF